MFLLIFKKKKKYDDVSLLASCNMKLLILQQLHYVLGTILVWWGLMLEVSLCFSSSFFQTIINRPGTIGRNASLLNREQKRFIIKQQHHFSCSRLDTIHHALCIPLSLGTNFYRTSSITLMGSYLILNEKQVEASYKVLMQILMSYTFFFCFFNIFQYNL